MSEKLVRVEDTVAIYLSQLDTDVVERSVIEEAIKTFAPIFGVYSDQDIEIITKRLEERFNISMSLGTLFASEDYRPWLDEARGEINWYYWLRYRRLLLQQQFPQQVINGLDSITDQILDHLENPNKVGLWTRKGMVVGHVQSGKTANYIGLINKAADSGYKVIIILAGMLNSLRNQTQFRVDGGFIGIDTERKAAIGVGLLSNEKSPAYFTTNKEDFKKSVANNIGVGIGGLRDPVVFVIKKNKSTLENLIDWLKHNNPHNLKSHPMLLVDDEADHASINTNKEGDIATTINRKIRELLHLFDRSSYLGYTATPFANVFIDPETEDEMLGDDLFPRDFIISLDPPSNYVGSARVFTDNGDLNIVRVVDDYGDWLPLKHKKDRQLDTIPDSLKESIMVFILSRAVRLLREQANAHNSMLINVSRFTAVQSNVKLLVDEYLKEIRQAIINHYKLNIIEALKNSTMATLKNIFDNEFRQIGHTWCEVQTVLKDAVSPIGVIEVNSSSAAEPLDYSQHNYPQGRNVIAVGGMSLSRGLTLEGLTVSYFLRNSVMYDTLMQMGRWFGYRDGYADLCRIYMTAEAESWYTHISDVTDELREEFKRMKAAGMSPQDFGLCVRGHPESLIVTARNKMRTGTYVLRKVSLEGRLVETSILLNKAETFHHNFTTMEEMVRDADQFGVKKDSKPEHIWQNVPAEYVLQFVERFENHPASQLTEKLPLKDHIEWLISEGVDRWDVVLVTLSKGDESSIHVKIGNFHVITQRRNVTRYPEGGKDIALNKHRVASRGLEKAGLSEGEIKQAEGKYQGKNIPDHAYRSVRSRPLLMLHLLDCQLLKDVPLFKQGVAAYGISFPGEAGSRNPQKLVEYVVNTVWWKNEYQEFLDEEEEYYDE